MDKVSEAVSFAAEVFDGKKRKCSNTPAVLHSLEAAAIAASMTDEEDVIAAAVLHDTQEDAGVSFEELERRFGARTAGLIRAESEDKRRELPPADTWRIRKEESVNYLRTCRDTGVKIVFLSDKLSNMRSIYCDLKQCGESLWERFNQTDPRQHYWYYRSLAEAMKDLSAYPAWQEYDWLIREVFEKR
mgnify:CR=1 FL=1